jgi:hypothetical protein
MKQQMLGLMILCTMIQENKVALHVAEIHAVLLEILVVFKEERLDGQLADVNALLEEPEM